MNEPGVQLMLNGNAFAGRDGHKPKWVILHATAGGSSAQNIASYFKSTQGGSNPVSAHYVIGQDGTIVACNDENDGAWSNGGLTQGHDAFWDTIGSTNPNDVTIAIEHVKPSIDNSDQITPAQQSASFTLIQHICQRWNIPMQTADANGGVTGHFSLDPKNRSRCPGPYPWDALWAFLKQPTPNPGGDTTVTISLSQPEVASYFSQAPGGAWNCKAYNTVIGGAILDSYRSWGNTALCGLTFLGLPLTNEVGIATNCVIQRFERGVLAYDPTHRIDNLPGYGNAVYPIKIYSGIGSDPRIKTQQDQITQLQAQVKQLQAQINAQPAPDATVTKLEAQLSQIHQEVATSIASIQKIDELTHVK